MAGKERSISPVLPQPSLGQLLRIRLRALGLPVRKLTRSDVRMVSREAHNVDAAELSLKSRKPYFSEGPYIAMNAPRPALTYPEPPR
jgi:hypothetical protein